VRAIGAVEEGILSKKNTDHKGKVAQCFLFDIHEEGKCGSEDHSLARRGRGQAGGNISGILAEKKLSVKIS